MGSFDRVILKAGHMVASILFRLQDVDIKTDRDVLGCTDTAELKNVAQPYKTKVVPFGLCVYNPDVVVSFVGVQEYHQTSCQNPLGG